MVFNTIPPSPHVVGDDLTKLDAGVQPWFDAGQGKHSQVEQRKFECTQALVEAGHKPISDFITSVLQAECTV